MVTLHLIQQAHTHAHNAAETVAQAYDLTLTGIEYERGDGGDLDCEHCGRVITADEPYHTHIIGGALRPICSVCDAREPE